MRALLLAIVVSLLGAGCVPKHTTSTVFLVKAPLVCPETAWAFTVQVWNTEHSECYELSFDIHVPDASALEGVDVDSPEFEAIVNEHNWPAHVTHFAPCTGPSE